ncbi:P-loop NTPase fold protein [Acinetobacter harbinensis]|uniref:P-loop NTPase fold protein n=1 Tax=Acinetobacter harbinensis TaxID=1353941 RepID=UPI001C4FE433|nr:P-loop NTPase fold protein [Acinetobacter harbinensis]
MTGFISEPNKHIEKYFDYYFDGEKNFEYAVLLNGAWGSGKTWFIKEYIQKQESKGKKVAYISLNGLSKTSDIDDEIFRCIHPKLASKGAKILGKVAKGALKAAFRFDWDGDSKPDGQVSVSVPDIELPDYLKITSKFILVFDDLERCKLKIEEVLGYINYFVEQESIKTLIISNATEIQQNEYFLKIKEKLVGATFNYTEDQDLAIQSILNEVLDGDLKTLITSNLELTKQIFNQVGYQNLRSFKQTVFDFKRFYKKEFFEWNGNFESEIFEKVLKAFLILSLENKKGRFEKEILNFKLDELEPTADEKRKRALRHLSSFVGEDAQKFQKKYQMRLNEYIFSKNLWNQILNLNSLNDEIINKELYEIYFRFKKDQPIWYKLWHYLDLKELDFTTLAKNAKESVEKSELTNETDILHTISMLVYFEEQNLISFPVENLLVLAIEQFKKIVKLKENIKKPNFFDIREASGGYGLYAREFPIFENFIEDLAQAYEDKYVEKNIDRVQELLSLMDKDTYEFYQQITDKYHDYPILKSLEPVDFLDQLLKIDYRNAMNAIDGLSSRYTTHSQTKIYLQEEDWFEKIIALANERLALATMLEKHKIQDKFLPKLGEIKQQAYKG